MTTSRWDMAWDRACSRLRYRSGAFQKKSTQGTKTPKREIELIEDRLKRLKEMLR